MLNINEQSEIITPNKQKNNRIEIDIVGNVHIADIC